MEIIIQALKKSGKLFFFQSLIRVAMASVIGFTLFIIYFYKAVFPRYQVVILALTFLFIIFTAIEVFVKGLQYLKPEEAKFVQLIKTSPDLLQRMSIIAYNLQGQKYPTKIKMMKFIVELATKEKYEVFIPTDFLKPVITYISSVAPKAEINYGKPPTT